MKTLILGGQILTPDRLLNGFALEIEGQKIRSLQPFAEDLQPEIRVIDADGLYVVPGFIDLHIHGAAGADTMDATPQALDTICRSLAHSGVTSFLPTTVSASPADILAAIDNLAAYPSTPAGAVPLGVHVEGPYLNEANRGAQPLQHLRHADKEEYDLWLSRGAVRLVTVAPEVPGVLDLISAGVEQGVEFAIGHSQATYEQTLEAVECGLRQVTHIFNGMPGLHHRTPGILGAALTDDRVFCQVIADGVHLHPAIVNLLVRAKGPGGIILISDSIRAAGLDDGKYSLGDQEVVVRDGVVRTAAGGLAGSTLTMDQALRNIMQFASLSLSEALPMATSVPANAIGLSGLKGRLAAGADADIVFLDHELNVQLTMVAGHIVYQTDRK